MHPELEEAILSRQACMRSPSRTGHSRDALSPQLVLGLAILLFGTLITLDNFGWLEFSVDSYRSYWPLVFVVIGLVKLSQVREGTSTLGGFIWIIVGSVLLSRNLGWIQFSIRDLFPLALVAIGGFLVWRALTGHARPSRGSVRERLEQRIERRAEKWAEKFDQPVAPETPSASPPGDAASVVNGFALLAGLERVISSQNFEGGQMTAVMGGCELDLRHASIQPGSEPVIDVFAFWGGIDVRVPDDWVVVSRVLPIMGGYVDKSHPPKSGTTKQLVMRGLVIMGGVEVRN
jgi:hypothetical protein